MISNISDKKICIHITIYKHKSLQEKPVMNDKNNKSQCKSNKFICAICLNSKQENKNGECIKKINKSCPICQKSCDYCQNNLKKTKVRIDNVPMNETNVKNVQTSETDVSQGLNLLNEVLTVFQNKKVENIGEKTKPGTFKDVGVLTEDNYRKDQSKLTVCTFHFSIDHNRKEENGKFIVLSSWQPNFLKKCVNSVDLIKHKSCSIPQMKLEELKHSLKEKSRSKDAIEEVNRMFATVRRSSNKTLENFNRPVVRNGPRVLPVVKTLVGQGTEHINVESIEAISCKCCQTCLSSGDSFMKPECWHEKKQCDKPVYMVCCHYQNRQLHSGMICDRCRSLNDDCEHVSLHGNCC